MATIENAESEATGGSEWGKAAAIYVGAFIVAALAEMGIQSQEPLVLPNWFGSLHSIVLLMVGIVFVSVAFFPLNAKDLRKMAWANAAFLAVPYATMLVFFPAVRALVTGATYWPTAFTFLAIAVFTNVLILAAARWFTRLSRSSEGR